MCEREYEEILFKRKKFLRMCLMSHRILNYQPYSNYFKTVSVLKFLAWKFQVNSLLDLRMRFLSIRSVDFLSHKDTFWKKKIFLKKCATPDILSLVESSQWKFFTTIKNFNIDIGDEDYDRDLDVWNDDIVLDINNRLTTIFWPKNIRL